MAAGYQVWYGHEMVLTDTAVRIEARRYAPLLHDMGFKFVQVMRYCPPLRWGRVMTVAQYISHKMPSKLLRIDHETGDALRHWRKRMAYRSKNKNKLVDGMRLEEFNEIQNLRCPDCNAALNGFEYIKTEPELRFKVFCHKKPCKVYINLDPKTMKIEVNRQ
jgi:hypothetical protein